MGRSRYGFSFVLACLTIASAAYAHVPGDSDGDGDLDFDDFLVLSLCQFGPELPAISLCQELFDHEFDGDVDMADFATMQRCISGANQPADPHCAPHIIRVESGCLIVIGTAADSELALRLATGAPEFLEIDVANDGIAEFAAQRSLFDCIIVHARGGDDLVLIDETNGVFTDTELTTLKGDGGNDTLHGGSGGELLIGGDGDDLMFAGGGADRFVWNPGDDTDVLDGGDGVDTAEVNGADSGEAFTVTANGTRVRFDRLSPAPFSLDLAGCEQLILNANGGNDSLACTGNLAPLIQITAYGGPGNDTLLGSNGVDLLFGGDDSDFIDGQQGNDVAFLGAGDDTFQWDPGDGSDTVEGEGGHDTLLFNGSNGSEIFDFSANGSRLRFTRNLGNIVMDVNGLEQFDLLTLGEADTVVVNHLAGVNLGEINILLSGTFGGTAGDGRTDIVIVNATEADDTLSISGSGDAATVHGLATAVNVRAAEFANDRITINALGGADTLHALHLAPGVVGVTMNGGPGSDTFIGSPAAGIINGDEDVDTVEVNGGAAAESYTVTANGARVRLDQLSPTPFFLDIGGCERLELNAGGGNDSLACTGNLAALIQIIADGGPGDDTLLGSNGGDQLFGGDDDDFIDGQQGNDIVFLGAGDDVFQWDPGDGSDIVEGNAGRDVLRFNGSAGNELFEFLANGSRLRFSRNLGNISMDVNAVEQVDLRALGGTDGVTINDLTGVGLSEINVILAATIGGSAADGLADAVTVNGTVGADTIDISASVGVVEVSGLAALVRIAHADASLDSLVVNGQAGVDTITSDPTVSTLLLLFVNP